MGFRRSLLASGSCALSRASGKYKVTRDLDDNWTCDCEDFKNWEEPCKHIYRVYSSWFYNAPPVPTPGEPVTPPKKYTQDWANYDMAQMEEVRLLPTILRAVIDEIVAPPPTVRGRGRPMTPLADQMFCGVQKVYSHFSCRRSHGFIEQARDRNQVSVVPFYDVSSKFLLNPASTPLLHDLIRLTALPMASLDRIFATDSTGFRTTSFGDYSREAHGDHRTNIWLRLHAAVGVDTHVFARAKVMDGNSADCPQFPELLKGIVEDGFKVEEVVADKAYLSRLNLETARNLGIKPFVPFKRNSTSRGGGSALYHRLYHYFQLHREEFDQHYHQRSNIEAAFGALKTKFGETLKSRDRTAQENELLAKVGAYNITVLIHEMFEHNLVPEFLLPRKPGGVAPIIRPIVGSRRSSSLLGGGPDRGENH